jgi:hypothetical protein
VKLPQTENEQNVARHYHFARDLLFPPKTRVGELVEEVATGKHTRGGNFDGDVLKPVGDAYHAAYPLPGHKGTYSTLKKQKQALDEKLRSSKLCTPTMPWNILDMGFPEKSAAYTARADTMEAIVAVASEALEEMDFVGRRMALEKRHVKYVQEENDRYLQTVEAIRQAFDEKLKTELEEEKARHEQKLEFEKSRHRGEAKFDEEVFIEVLRVQIKKDRENADRYSGGGGGGGAARVRPDGHSCPIISEVMEDPVLAMDGNTYERSAIEKWLGTNDTSPLTNETMPSKMLVPNLALRKMIEDWVA